MPTLEDIRAWLSTQGLEPPELVVVSWLDLLEDLEPCFIANGYSDSTIRLIVFHLLALYGLSGGNRYISSQTAPSGASRSFRYADLRNGWRGQLGMLRLLDTANCTRLLIPRMPGARNIAIGVATGDCQH
jgi:hypothetical protein